MAQSVINQQDDIVFEIFLLARIFKPNCCVSVCLSVRKLLCISCSLAFHTLEMKISVSFVMRWFVSCSSQAVHSKNQNPLQCVIFCLFNIYLSWSSPTCGETRYNLEQHQIIFFWRGVFYKNILNKKKFCGQIYAVNTAVNPALKNKLIY